jgi:hypothetical protein
MLVLARGDFPSRSRRQYMPIFSAACTGNEQGPSPRLAEDRQKAEAMHGP